jgi:hypothetical protein
VFAYNPVMQVLNIRFIQQAEFFAPLKGVVAWLDNSYFPFRLIYQKNTYSISANSHFGVILTFNHFSNRIHCDYSLDGN